MPINFPITFDRISFLFHTSLNALDYINTFWNDIMDLQSMIVKNECDSNYLHQIYCRATGNHSLLFFQFQSEY